MMASSRTLAVLLSVMLAVAAAAPQHVRARRQLADDNTLQPIEDGITSHRQARSTDGSPARVSLFPTSSSTKQSSSITPDSRSITPHSSSITPNLRSITQQSTSITPKSRSITPLSPSITSNTGSITSRSTNPLTKAGTDRGARQADDIPVFDRNKVSLEFPGSMFGPTLSLLIRTTKIVGDVIQNSAVRYQTFLRLFRPLFRGQFEIKGLDPATTTTSTTTTTTTTTTAAPARAADNEIRRR